MKFLIAMGENETRDSFFTKPALDKLAQHGELVFNKTGKHALDKQDLIAHIKDIDVLFSGWGTARLDADVLAAANKLKIHAHTGGSLAPYVSKEEYDQGIVVLSGNDIYAKSVAEGCLAYTLIGLRRAYDYIDVMRKGGWRPTPDTTQGLIGKKVGIVGYGAISRYYVDLLKWFGVDLYVYSKYITEAELKRIGAKAASKEEIFSTCDVVSLHAALNDENRGQITKELITSIKDGALFVNTARAGLVDDAALLEELEKKRFSAVVDVYLEEPLVADSAYRTLDNVIAFPHIAGPTFDMRERVVFELLEDVLRVGRDEPVKMGIPYEYAIRMTM
jgi:phosphoglycerate dehydrogenase-like enzyme